MLPDRSSNRNPRLSRGKLDLTPAEQSAWDLRDKPVTEIAQLLGLSPKTIAKYLTIAREKIHDKETLAKLTGR